MSPNNTTTKMGRPPKTTVDAKKHLVATYFLSEANGDAAKMRVHNIYALLAEYAERRGYPLKAYDFSKDQELRSFIQDLRSNDDLQAGSKITTPAFIPFDVKKAAYMEKEKLCQVLVEREQYFQKIYNQASVAIESYFSLSSQFTSIKELFQEKSKLADTLECKNTEYKKEYLALEKENSYLKSYIRHHVQPEQAEAFFKKEGRENFNNDNDKARLATVPLSSYIEVDKAMEADAEKQSHQKILSLFE